MQNLFPLLVTTLVLTACGGSGSAPANAPAPSATAPTALTRTKAEAAGTHCAEGGARVDVGSDNDGNGVLSDGEVTSTLYVCNAPGSNGANGQTSLVRMLVEPVGTNCPQGGTKVLAGKDGNGNGALEDSEVSSFAYVCSAAPADNRWVELTGGSTQAQSNTGYLANSATLVVITLPTAPAVGDWVKVTGVGSGGWTIAQNAGQSINARGLPGGMALEWAAHGPVGAWASLAASSDGLRIVAASASGELYTSTDGGANWVLRLGGQTWSSVASSSDGMKLVAASNGGALYLSSDGGQTWSNDGSARAWTAVASSADGMQLVAAEYLGRLWTSTDGGGSWTARESNRAWRAVTSSSDGGVLAAGTNGAQLYVSTDHGITWTARASGQYWWSLSASADGKFLYGSTDTGALWVSKDSGTTWESQAGSRDWRGIATSADGRFTVAATSGGQLYDSMDQGLTWRATASGGLWSSVAISADGLTVFAAQSGGAIHTGSRRTSTTVGGAGSISGGPQDALQLQYVGGGVFMPIGYVTAGLQFIVR